MSLSNMLAGMSTTITVIEHACTELLHFFLYLLYVLESVICRVLIWFPEQLFKSLCGIGNTWYYGTGADMQPIETSNGVTTDIVLAFIRNSAVQDTFWAVLGFSVALLFVLTLIAVVRSEFTLDPSKAAKGPIIGRAFKALANFLLVPVLSIAFIYGANLAVKAIYSLSTGGDDTLALNIFELTTDGANRVTLEDSYGDGSGTPTNGSFAYYLLHNGNDGNALPYIKDGNPSDLFGTKITTSSKDLADAIDRLFRANLTSSTLGRVGQSSSNLSGAQVEGTEVGDHADVKYVQFYTKPVNNFSDAVDEQNENSNYYIPWQTYFVTLPPSMKGINYAMFNARLVNFFYDVSEMNLIIGVGSAFIVGLNMLGIIVLLLKRAFELVILFAISPVVVSLYPLDDGSATANWRKQFRNRVLAPTTIVFVYNIFFMLINLLDVHNLGFFSSGPLANGFFRLFFKIVVVYVASSLLKTASKTLCDLLGIEDMVGGAGDALKNAWSTAKGAARTGVSMVMAPGRFVGAARRVGNKVINGIKDTKDRWDEKKERKEQAEKTRDAIEDDLSGIKEQLKDKSLSEEERADLKKQKDAKKKELYKANQSVKAAKAEMHDESIIRNIRDASTSLHKGKDSRLKGHLTDVNNQLEALEDKDDPESIEKRKELEAKKKEIQSAISDNDLKHAVWSRRTRHLGFIGLNSGVDNDKIHQKPLGEIGQSFLDILGNAASEGSVVGDVIRFTTDKKARNSAFLPSSIVADRTAKEEQEKEKKKNREYLAEQAKINEEQAEKREKAQRRAENARRTEETASRRENDMSAYVDAAIRADKSKGGLLEQYTELNKINVAQAEIDKFRAKVAKNEGNELFNQANRVNNKNKTDSSITDEMVADAKKKLADAQREIEAEARQQARQEHDESMKKMTDELKKILEESSKNHSLASDQLDNLVDKLGKKMQEAVKAGYTDAKKDEHTNFDKYKIGGEMGELINQIKTLNNSTTINNDDINTILELLKGLEDRINGH